MAKKALIAMSGGVDSSVAAVLMKEQGFDCTGITMKLYDNGDIGLKKDNTCCSADDIDDARAVCRALDIPYYVFNFRSSFNEQVIDRFVRAYECGVTPNPCIDCNRYIKFDRLLRRMKELDMDYIVTGHYARINFDGVRNRYILKKAADSVKDQSYVLYSLTQEQLKHTLLPLGDMTKDKSREIASKHGLVNAEKHDSQDICFVPDGKYAEFIEKYTGREYPCGDFTDRSGNVLGRHKGIIRYTIGQRKGLGLALPKPMYVCEKDVKNNRVVLCDNEQLYSRELYADNINLITCGEIKGQMRVKAKVRYSQAEQPATVEQVGKDRLHVVFDSPQRAISKGQAVVLYDGDEVVGGGTIL